MSLKIIKKRLFPKKKAGKATAEPLTTLEKINAYVVKQHGRPNKPGRLKPSMLGSPCMRKLYYSFYAAVPSNTDAKAGRRFDLGIAVEDMVMDWLKGIGEHIPYRNLQGEIPVMYGKQNSQVPISLPEWFVALGYIDNIALTDGKLWTYEIKSMKAEKFASLYEPLDDHKMQVSIYVKALNRMLQAGELAHIPELAGITKVEGVRFLYVNVDTAEVQQFDVLGTALAGYLALLEAKMPKVLKFIADKTLPVPTKHFCSTCPFQKLCKANANPI